MSIGCGIRSSIRQLGVRRMITQLQASESYHLPGFRARWLVLAFVAGTTAGCTLMVDRPQTFEGAQRANGIEYKEAIDYSNKAYSVFQKRRDCLDRFDV